MRRVHLAHRVRELGGGGGWDHIVELFSFQLGLVVALKFS